MAKNSKEEILKNAVEENVKYIRLMFTDIHGVIKNVEIPARSLEDALNNEIIMGTNNLWESSTINMRYLFT